MTHQQDFERELDGWFAVGPTHAPDWTLERVVERIDLERQRPAWRLAWRRPGPHLRSTIGLVGLAAVVVTGLLLAALVPGLAGIFGPPTSPAPTIPANPPASPSLGPSSGPSSRPSSTAGSDLVPMRAGTYHTERFTVPMRITIPDGWFAASDGFENRSAVTLEKRIGGGDPWTIQVLNDVHPPVLDDSGCQSAVAGPDEVHTAGDLLAYYADHPGLDVAIRPRSLGGHPAWSVAGGLRADWESPCPSERELVWYVVDWWDHVPVTVTGSETGPLDLVVDDGRGGALVVDVSAGSGELLDEVTRIVDSIVFDPVPPEEQPSPTSSSQARGVALGRLEPGSHGTQAFPAPFTYRVPDGWRNSADNAQVFALTPETGDDVGIEVNFDAHPYRFDGERCETRPDMFGPTSASDLVSAMEGNEHLRIHEQRKVRIGGLDGWRVVVSARRSPRCGNWAGGDDIVAAAFLIPWSSGAPVGPLILQDPRAFILLDAPGGKVIAIKVPVDGAEADRAMDVLRTFAFGATP
jgi:hypothetical protein